MSRFFCDADCELDYKAIKELDISLIKMPYSVDGKEYYFDCGETTDFKGFFDKMRRGAAAKTQALNKFDYINYFEPVYKENEDIIYVSFSHKMSGTFSYMQAALDELAQTYPSRKCTVIDTESISMGAGIIVYYAAKLHNSGASDQEVASFVSSFKQKVKVYFTVDDLEYLHRGGRLSGFKAGIGTLLGVKPIIGIKEGVLVNLEKVKGRKKALLRLISLMENIDTNYPVVILNADSTEDEEFTEKLIKERYDVQIWDYNVGPVIGSHCGPDTIGIIFVDRD